MCYCLTMHAMCIYKHSEDLCLQTESFQNCMLSNKAYYAPVLEDEQMFVESKEKFDTATSSQSPQELKDSSDSEDAEKNDSSESQPEQEGRKQRLTCGIKHTHHCSAKR